MTKKLTTFAIFAAIMAIGGYILYFATRLIPIPGSKFIIMGPYLTFMLMLVLLRYPRLGTLSLINFVFGGLMFIFSPWMTLAIIVSGVAADLVMLLPVLKKIKQLLAMGVYNASSLLTTIFVANYITGSELYKILDIKILLVASLLSAITGALGGFAALKMSSIYLKPIMDKENL